MLIIDKALSANQNTQLQKTQTALSDRNYNDATVKALFRLMEQLKESDYVTGMSVSNHMTQTGLYKVELTASFQRNKNKSPNKLADMKSKLDKALHRSQSAQTGYQNYPSKQAASIYQNNDIDARSDAS